MPRSPIKHIAKSLIYLNRRGAESAEKNARKLFGDSAGSQLCVLCVSAVQSLCLLRDSAPPVGGVPSSIHLLKRLANSGLLAGLLMIAATPALAGISGLSADNVPWQALHYQAARGIATLNVDIRLNPVAPDHVQAAGAAANGLPALPAPYGPMVELRAVIDLATLFGNYRTDDRIWLRPGNIAAVEREKVRSGTKQYIKRFRYDANNAWRVRIRPDGKSQRKSPPEHWSDRETDRYQYRQAAAACPVVAEPGALFYLAGAHDFSDGNAIDLCVFSDSALFRMRVEPMGRETIDVDYTLTRKGKTERIRGSTQALRLQITAKPLPGAARNADFEILDFKGSQELLMDTKLRIPLRIQGSLPGMGRGDVDNSAGTRR